MTYTWFYKYMHRRNRGRYLNSERAANWARTCYASLLTLQYLYHKGKYLSGDLKRHLHIDLATWETNMAPTCQFVFPARHDRDGLFWFREKRMAIGEGTLMCLSVLCAFYPSRKTSESLPFTCYSPNCKGLILLTSVCLPELSGTNP